MFEIQVEKFYPSEADKECYIEIREPSFTEKLCFLDVDSSTFGPNKENEAVSPEVTKKQNEVVIDLLKKCIISFEGFKVSGREVPDINSLMSILPDRVMLPLQKKFFEMANLKDEEIKK